jgi:hypothetical protein
VSSADPDMPFHATPGPNTLPNMDEVPINTSLPPKPSRNEPGRNNRLLLRESHIEEVEKLLPRTLYVETVAAQLGVHRQTFWQWIKAGSAEARRREDGEQEDTSLNLHTRLYYTVKKVLAISEMDSLAMIQAAGCEPKAWTALAWILERRFPERWAQNRGEMKALAKQLAEVLKGNANVPATPQGQAQPVQQVTAADKPDDEVGPRLDPDE